MIKEIVQVGLKGSDIVLSTLNRINKKKDEFGKAKKLGLSISALQAGRRADIKQKSKEDQESKLKDLGFSNVGIKAAQDQQIRSENRLSNSARSTGEVLRNLGQSASTLDPTAALTGVVDATLGTFEKIGNKFGGGLGTAIGLIAGGAKEVANIGIQGATNAVNAVKTALPIAIETQEFRGKKDFYGGAAIFNSGKNGTANNYSVAEQSRLLDSVTNKFGKISDKFGNSIKSLLDSKKDLSQVSAVSTGNFSALGTNKGFFYQKIADQFSGLPPKLAQAMQNKLQQGVKLDEYQDDLATKARTRQAGFDDVERNRQENIAKLGGSIGILNGQMATLSINLVKLGSVGSELTAQFTKLINKTSELIGRKEKK